MSLWRGVCTTGATVPLLLPLPLPDGM